MRTFDFPVNINPIPITTLPKPVVKKSAALTQLPVNCFKIKRYVVSKGFAITFAEKM